jgi:hypothetical protein
VFAALRLKLTLIQPQKKACQRTALNESKKQSENSGKDNNELLEISNPLEQTRAATNACQRHVPENRGMNVNHVQHAILASATDLAREKHHCNKSNTIANILTNFHCSTSAS